MGMRNVKMSGLPKRFRPAGMGGAIGSATGLTLYLFASTASAVPLQTWLVICGACGAAIGRVVSPVGALVGLFIKLRVIRVLLICGHVTAEHARELEREQVRRTFQSV